jgi:hypothetical protein
MGDAREVLDEIQQRADTATDGPWTTFDTSSTDQDLNDGLPHILMPASMRDRLAWNEIGYVSEDYPDDAEFIVHARADVPKLVAALRAVLDLHKLVEIPDPRDEPGQPEYYGTDRACGHCGRWGDDYPCETVQAITEALGGTDA